MSNINFNCDVCGREVQGYTFVNGMKFCAKCYQETFGNNTSQFIDLLNKEMYELKNAILEKQLAEKDKEANQRYKDWQEEIRECDRLRVLLAEKEIKYYESEWKGCQQDLYHYKGECFNLQDEQNQKAIQQLEKVKEEMTYNGNGYCEVRQCSSPHAPNLNFAWFNYVVFNKFIDNQIKQLKEWK